jgi:hypothetical protein
MILKILQLFLKALSAKIQKILDSETGQIPTEKFMQ